MNNVQLINVKSGVIMSFEDWCEVYEAQLDNWSTYEAKNLVNADIILKILKVVDQG